MNNRITVKFFQLFKDYLQNYFNISIFLVIIF